MAGTAMVLEGGTPATAAMQRTDHSRGTVSDARTEQGLGFNQYSANHGWRSSFVKRAIGSRSCGGG